MIYLGLISDESAAVSPLPQIHEAALRAASLAGTYLAFEVDPAQVGEAVRGLDALGFRGVNVGEPYQRAVVPHLAGLSDEAMRLGAADTLVKGAGGLWGYHTGAAGAAAAQPDDGGRSELSARAALSFELWTGIKLPPQIFLTALKSGAGL
ncbi:hypothetical protein C4J81_05020 [Deltaproteobacteria bacterium Smac51]|nr:hypothetical protein C4J81_05020 [Deltaproteobacteria bacterium Smac51]